MKHLANQPISLITAKAVVKGLTEIRPGNTIRLGMDSIQRAATPRKFMREILTH
jgi:hypothetical protein